MTRRLAIACFLLTGTLHAQSFDELLKKGKAQLDSGKADDAVATLEKAVKASPQSAQAHMQLGNALGTVAQKANVFRQPLLARRLKAEFEKAVELDPNLIDAHDGLMQFYMQAPGVMGGSMGKAREEAAAIAKINPMRGRFAEASIANHEKDSSSVEKAYRAAATEFPDSINAVGGWVNFVTQRGRAEEAFAPLDRFLAKNPESRPALFWIGRAAAITGKQLDRGEQALRQLLSTPDAPGSRVAPEAIHFRLGDIAAKRGDKAKAKSEYEESIRINPKFEQARKALNAL